MIPGRDFALDAGDGKRSSDGSGGMEVTEKLRGSPTGHSRTVFIYSIGDFI
jgi:hypothetical protein